MPLQDPSFITPCMPATWMSLSCHPVKEVVLEQLEALMVVEVRTLARQSEDPFS